MKKMLLVLCLVVLLTGCTTKSNETEMLTNLRFDTSVLVATNEDGYLPYTSESIMNAIESCPGFSKETISINKDGTDKECFDVYYYLDGRKDNPIAIIFLTSEDNCSKSVSFSIAKNNYYENAEHVDWWLTQLCSCFNYVPDDALFNGIREYVETPMDKHSGDEYLVFKKESIAFSLINLDSSVQIDICVTKQD